MKKIKSLAIVAIAGALLLGETGCGSMTNTGKGALIGGGSGAGVGAGIGALIGGGKGAGIGAAIGAAVGTGAGVLIGKKMDKQQKELEAQLANSAKVEQTTDANGLQAIKVTFEGGILFPTGKYTLNSNAKSDNTGSYQVNETLSGQRANAVRNFLINCGVTPSRITAQGIPMADYVASNDTPEGRAMNRRVEVYITANKQMIEQAQSQASK